MQRTRAPKPSEMTSPTLSVVSYNIHRCVGTDGKYDPERVAQVLRSLDADVIALQEVDSDPGFQGGIDQFRYLARMLEYEVVEGAAVQHSKGCYGNAILTRGRVLQVNRHDLSCPRQEPRCALDVEIELQGVTMRVVNTHLGLRRGERFIQISRILEQLPGRSSMPVILLGDLNEWNPVGRTLRLLASRFGVTPAVKSFPSRFPLFALDRVWVNPRPALQELSVCLDPIIRSASDHLPVRARLSLDVLASYGRE